MSLNFDERSGEVPCKTAWGSWYQTMEEVFIEVNVPLGTSAKDVKCNIGSKQIELHVKSQQIFKVIISSVIKIPFFFNTNVWYASGVICGKQHNHSFIFKLTSVVL